MNYFNPAEKRKTRKQILDEYCKDHVAKQQKEEIFFRKRPNQMLIRDKNDEYKVVSKTYYHYYMENDEYDTEKELEDEEWTNYVADLKLRLNH
jgi:hypothetical protein